MKPMLTIFTPTYNRSYILHQCYESLKRQTCKDFIWLIIDDGSIDDTQKLVMDWISENKLCIKYVYQENQGMHGAHNTAYKMVETELNVCIDSDDFMADDAVEKIVTFWRNNGSDKYAGIIGLDATKKGELIGTSFPKNLKETTLYTLYDKYKVKGDKKLVYRTELVKKIPPYPVFPNEKYFPLSYKYLLIDQQQPLLIMNEILCHVEYLEDGSSLNIISQYKKNPYGFSFFRKEAMKYAPSLKSCFRETIHYISSNLMVKNYKFLNESPRLIITLLSIPLGVILFLYIQNTNKHTVMKKT